MSVWNVPDAWDYAGAARSQGAIIVLIVWAVHDWAVIPIRDWWFVHQIRKALKLHRHK